MDKKFKLLLQSQPEELPHILIVDFAEQAFTLITEENLQYIQLPQIILDLLFSNHIFSPYILHILSLS